MGAQRQRAVRLGENAREGAGGEVYGIYDSDLDRANPKYNYFATTSRAPKPTKPNVKYIPIW